MEFTVQRRRQLLNTPSYKTFCQTGVFARKENGRAPRDWRSGDTRLLEGEGEELVKGAPSADVIFKLGPERGAGVNKVKSQEHSRQRE